MSAGANYTLISVGQVSAGGNVNTSLVLNADGTVSAPSYAFINSLSTGMYSPASNQGGLTANGQLAIQWAKDAGAFPIVGIGTAPVTNQTLTLKGQGTGPGTDNITSTDSSNAATFRVTANGRVITTNSSQTNNAGSAATPAFYTTSGGNNGFYSTGTGLGLASAGVAALTFDGSQNGTFAAGITVPTLLTLSGAAGNTVISTLGQGTLGEVQISRTTGDALRLTSTVNGRLSVDSLFGWSSGNGANTARDTTLYRDSAGVVGINAGVSNTATGSFKAATFVVGAATIRSGTGTPASAVTGNVGDIFLRTDGGTSTTLYVKETGNGTNTGWVAK